MGKVLAQRKSQRVMIHACPPRMWFVTDFIVPDLKEQGFADRDIVIWNDFRKRGNLFSFVDACEAVKQCFDPQDSMWHIQDDVCISESFAERIKQCDKPDAIYNGFVARMCNAKEVKKIGWQKYPDNWFSFPCFCAPNWLVNEFFEWFQATCVRGGLYKKYVDAGKYDDMLFWRFVGTKHKAISIYNIAPNLVEHVDYLCSGSVVNAQRKGRAMSAYWNENKRIETLERKVKEYGKTAKRD